MDGLRKAGEGGAVTLQGEADELVASVVQELVGSRFKSPLIICRLPRLHLFIHCQLMSALVCIVGKWLGRRQVQTSANGVLSKNEVWGDY